MCVRVLVWHAVKGVMVCVCVCLRVLLWHAVKGVTVYFSDFKRSLVDKMTKDFFTEPSQVRGEGGGPGRGGEGREGIGSGREGGGNVGERVGGWRKGLLLPPWHLWHRAPFVSVAYTLSLGFSVHVTDALNPEAPLSRPLPPHHPGLNPS